MSTYRPNSIVITWSILICLGIGACTNPAPSAPSASGPAESPPATSTPRSMSMGDITARPKPDGCPRLESLLSDIARAPDPLALARQYNLPLDDSNRIQVQITLADSATADVTAYGTVITRQSGTTAQGFAPFDQLCALSNDPAVLMVRVAGQIQPAP